MPDKQKDSGNRIYAVFFPVAGFCMLLDIASMPEIIDVWRPSLTTLILIFFATYNDRKINIEIAFGIGLLIDLLIAAPLGSNAFLFASQVFIIVSQFKKFFAYALYQQSILIGVVCLVAHIITYWFLHLIGVQSYYAIDWQQALSMALVWPLASYLCALLCRMFDARPPWEQSDL